MQFKLKEGDILDFLELNFPDQTFEKGRLLVGQNKKEPFGCLLFRERFFCSVNCSF